MMKFLKSVVDLTEAAAKIVTEPARMVLDGTTAMVKPVADTLEDIADEVSEVKEDMSK